jgi:hypothetical protein
VLSGVLLWLALRNVELGDVMRALRNANGPLFLLSAVVSTCIFPLRAIRWRSILAPVAGAVPFGPLWRSTAIGMMVNNWSPPARAKSRAPSRSRVKCRACRSRRRSRRSPSIASSTRSCCWR